MVKIANITIEIDFEKNLTIFKEKASGSYEVITLTSEEAQIIAPYLKKFIEKGKL